jgi:hypothetical protein
MSKQKSLPERVRQAAKVLAEVNARMYPEIATPDEACFHSVIALVRAAEKFEDEDAATESEIRALSADLEEVVRPRLVPVESWARHLVDLGWRKTDTSTN